MYPIGTAFKHMLGPDGKNRTIEWYGTMTTEAGEVYEINTRTIAPGTGRLEGTCPLPFVGGAYSKTLQMHLNLQGVEPRTLKNATIQMYAALSYVINDVSTWEDLQYFTWNELSTITWSGDSRTIRAEVPMGIYHVTKADRVLYSIKLEAYDGMLKFNTDLPTMDTKARSAFSWLKWMCDACGVELGMTAAQVKALPNGNRSFVYADVDSKIKTYRAVLGKLAAVLASVALIDRSGKLILKCIGVGRSYNGTVLPKLPQWDKSKYPYAAIFKYADVDYKNADYKLIAVPMPYFYVPSTTKEHIGTTARLRRSFHLSADGTRWIDKGEIEESDEGSWIVMLELYDGHTVVWTNTDIPYKDDESKLYAAASEPVFQVAEITPSDRFSSEYEDTQIRYTGLTAHYKAQAINEYYKNASALEDTGLVIDLGANPFLQISNNSARTTALQAIIDSLDGFSFTPFTASIPSHPEFDLMDVLSLTGGHAPANSYAPITSLVRTINGGVAIRCDTPEEQNDPIRSNTESDGLSSPGGTGYASSDFWIQIDSFPDAETTVTEETVTTELKVNCTVDNTTMQIAWTGFYSLDAAARVTARVLVDDEAIYEVSDDQTAGVHVLNVTTGHQVNRKGERIIKVTLREDAL